MAAPRSLTCCFSGHRPEKLPWRYNEDDPACTALKERLHDAVAALYAAGIRHFISGMARGCDLYFAEEVLRLREEHDDVTLEAAIPCDTQADGWPEADRKRYFRIAHQCDAETVVQPRYSPDCMTKRNRYMVDRSAVLLAVYDGAPGGTMQTVNYARSEGLEIIVLRP